MSPTDIELLHAWGEGDKRAVNLLFRRYFATLVRFFRNKVSGDLDDLVQQTLLACVEGRERVARVSSFRHYLFGIAYRVLANYYRKRGREPLQVDLGDSSIQDLAPGISSAISLRQEQQLLFDALRRIPLHSQVALELYYWEGLTSAAIAEVLEIPHGTAQTRLRRARELLVQAIEVCRREANITTELPPDLDAWAASLRDLAGS
ncbi:RNA polymerase sigma factor [Nannocystis radixulma]|uniref:Sigma-70 family RNA polymerase sigma factor n=1 Tax=Nannocystis radixulma TaxID=2995305 RepID=A0ABT5B194_9BACT|nr:sigma-70 family RNA polymerase sigma factor [Nannocystis radixulma]MDC0667877.1 sigma-70 family RNA polymerase sigma factor [Nannocystis radixulma]